MSVPEADKPANTAHHTHEPEIEREAPLANDADPVLVERELDGEGQEYLEGPEEIEELPVKEDDEIKRGPGSGLQRSASTWTQTTGTSVGTEVSGLPDAPLKKRKWTTRLNPLKTKYVPPVPKQRTPSREHGAGFFSLMYFQWINPLMTVGYQRTLEVNDIWSVNPDRSVYVLADKLYANIEKRKSKGSKRVLLLALFDTFRWEFCFGGAVALIAALLQVLSPFTSRFLIQYAQEKWLADNIPGPENPVPSFGYGIGLVFAITIMQMIQSMSTNHFIYRGMMVGGQARAVLIAVIFQKAMRISGRAKSGGKALDSEDDAAARNAKPGSKEERSFFEKLLNKNKKDNAGGINGVSGDGQGWSNGRIVNLMSTDTYRVDQACGMFHITWTSMAQILLALALLLVNITYSALAGFALIVITIPLLSRAIRVLMKRRKYINKVTDQRVSLTQEILSSVRFVKYFGWEMSFLDRLDKIRSIEVNKIAFLLSIRNAILAASLAVPIFASMLSFITYYLTGHALEAAKIFSSLALFNSLRIPLNLLPTVIGQVVDGNASINRIEEFLNAEDQMDAAEWDMDAEDAIAIHHADFTWERTPTQDLDNIPGKGLKSEKQIKQERKQSKTLEKVKRKSAHQKQILPTSSSENSLKDEKTQKASKSLDTTSSPSDQSDDEKNGAHDTSKALTLSTGEEAQEEKEPFKIKNIDLTIGRNELVAVIGSVGSGKSSLLAALAGDMRRTDGAVTFGSTRAFCPQYAWIQNATLKDNIIFGQPFDKRWYNEVIDACALRPDLEMLPNGDLTEIGERGITVSGGQKQRLNIARAIYFNADIVLMDDPLSAVDAHVGRHIMDQAICGLLKDKARVLATHQLHVLHRVDRIVWMKEGQIHKVATFDDLMANDEEFQKLMETTAVEEKKDDAAAQEDDAEEKKVVEKKKRKKGPGLMQAEERAVKGVGLHVYAAYIRATGSILVGPFVLFVLIISQGANIVTSLWLSYWTSNKFPQFSIGVYIGVYVAFGVIQGLLTFGFAAGLTIFGTRASKVMLHRAITRVLRAPMSFFDTTPLGRITNRFGKDVDTMDNVLTDSMRMFFLTMAMIVSVFILIIAYFPFFAVALFPLAIAFIFSANYYRASARELKRHESVLRSDVFSRFSEAVSGTATIRAYGLQKQFASSVNDAIDSMDGAYFLTYANQRWLSTRLDIIGNLLVFTVGILIVTDRFNVGPSASGLVLSYILTIVQMIQFTVRQLAEVENNMNSTERIHYYGTELEEEAPLHLGDVRKTWPERGEIIFDNVQMRYRAGLPLVLKGLTMNVKAGERIGIVGRTGAGKSTIMSTLFRLVELSGGSISIDGVDIATIGLHDLRSKLAIIPQDPTLFRGTIRSNLDPFNEHSDLDLWNALRQADLVGNDQKMDDSSARIQLDTQVDDEGLNFSLGQRQLLALARALVRGSQIIVCDEATSSVDFETDQKIQKTIVRGFKGKTLLCIAHRLKTIIGYDRILVMDAGNVAELDAPINLYDQGGIFRSMCDRSGIRREDFFSSEEAQFALESPTLEKHESHIPE